MSIYTFITPKTCRRMALTSATALALLAYPLYSGALTGLGLHDPAIAHAQNQGGQGQGGQGKGGQGYHGGNAGSGGSASGSHGSSSTSEGETDSDKKGPKFQGGENARKPADGERGGKPVWAQEGIPEVELGRLSVARAPNQVIDKALVEALANFDPAKSAALYSMTAEQFAAYLVANYDTVTRIDSPLENLGLYKDVLADGKTQLTGVTPASKIDLAAIFLGSASDKTIPVTTDTVIAVTKILNLTLTDAEVAALATKAEAVRAAILEGHGE